MEAYIMLLAIPVFMLLILIEYLIGKKQHKELYRLNDTIANLSIGIGNQVFSALTKGFIIFMLVLFGEKLALFHLPVNVWTVLLGFILYDFLFYWSHRWSHEINFFWGAHVVHHQSEEYNLAVALRQPWFHHLIMFFMFIPLPVLGFPAEVFLPVSLFNTLYQFWIHTRTINKFPKWVEFIFNTPSHHRVHHGIDPQYIDKNHGAVLIIWDRIFGTYQEEVSEPHYGITKPFNSWNPIWSNLHYYIEMFGLMRQTNNLKDKVRLIFARPGWRPDYLGGSIPIPEVSDNRTLFETTISKPIKRYATAQFVLCMLGIMAYIFYYPEMTLFFQISFAALQVLTLLIIGALLENQNWVKYIEHLRLLLVFACINSIYYINYQAWFELTLICSIIGLTAFGLWFAIRIMPVSLQKN